MSDQGPIGSMCQCGLPHVRIVDGRQIEVVWRVTRAWWVAGEKLQPGAVYLGKDGKLYQSQPGPTG